MRVFSSTVVLAVAILTASFVVAEEPISDAEAIAKIESLGGTIDRSGPVGTTVTSEPIPTAVIPFWWIVLPLTLISGYLLLSKPRPANRQRKAT